MASANEDRELKANCRKCHCQISIRRSRLRNHIIKCFGIENPIVNINPLYITALITGKGSIYHTNTYIANKGEYS